MEINDRKLPLRIDFISEFYYKNCQHIIDNILGELCPMTILRASTGHLIFKMSFWCHRLDQKTEEIFSRISALASKKRSNQKLCHTNYAK